MIVSGAQADLQIKLAGATAQDIEAQQAQVSQAQASVASVRAKLANSKIVAPISGLVTICDAKIGQVATPGTTLIAIISSNKLEADVQVPEIDIGKIAIGDPVTMNFDAFPNESFKGKVFYIDPAQTLNQGAVDYKVKVSFDTVDQRLKSGLTVNLNIETKTDENALILPQYAVEQNDQGTFIEKIVNNKASTTAVTLGIQDQNGNVEILTGVQEGDKVLNVGLKQ